MKTLNEKSMRNLEGLIPELAEGAVKQAYLNALALGNTVIEAVNGQLVEFYPDGSSKVIKDLPKAIPAVPGQRWKKKLK